jgi:hypothetical protein
MQFDTNAPPDPNRVIVMDDIDPLTNTVIKSYVVMCSGYDPTLQGGTWMFTGVQNRPICELENGNVRPIQSDNPMGLGIDAVAEMTWHYADNDILTQLNNIQNGGNRRSRRRQSRRKRQSRQKRKSHQKRTRKHR